MSKQSQILQIDPPNEIIFKGPFTDVVTSYIKLSNPSERQVCFKVKTTAPKQYCVRPNSGLIQPKETVSVSVMLQPFDYNVEDRNKHKFMVQTAYVPEGEHSLDNIWKNTPPAEMMDSKLRVVFDVPEQQASDKTGVSKPAAPPSIKSGSQPTDGEYRRAVDDAKRMQHQLYQLEHENGQLRERLQKMETAAGGGSGVGFDSGPGGVSAMQRQGHPQSQHYTVMHILLVFVIAAVVGLILGRSF